MLVSNDNSRRLVAFCSSVMIRQEKQMRCYADMQAKQCRAAAVASNCCEKMNAEETVEETVADTCEVTMLQCSNSSVDNLRCLLPQHWTSVSDSDVCTQHTLILH